MSGSDPAWTEVELQELLVRLWTNAADRTAFLSDPESWLSASGASSGAAEKLRRLDPAQLTGFADSLVRKRLSQVRQILPRTAVRLGPEFAARFTDWAGEHPPIEVHHQADDARQFGQMLLAQPLPADLRDLLRWELLLFRLEQPGLYCGATRFGHDVRSGAEAPLPRRTVFAVWWGGLGRSRPRLWLWP